MSDKYLYRHDLTDEQWRILAPTLPGGGCCERQSTFYECCFMDFGDGCTLARLVKRFWEMVKRASAISSIAATIRTKLSNAQKIRVYNRSFLQEKIEKSSAPTRNSLQKTPSRRKRLPSTKAFLARNRNPLCQKTFVFCRLRSSRLR